MAERDLAEQLACHSKHPGVCGTIVQTCKYHGNKIQCDEGPSARLAQHADELYCECRGAGAPSMEKDQGQLLLTFQALALSNVLP